jgi:hypothetical protein
VISGPAALRSGAAQADTTNGFRDENQPATDSALPLEFFAYALIRNEDRVPEGFQTSF